MRMTRRSLYLGATASAGAAFARGSWSAEGPAGRDAELRAVLAEHIAAVSGGKGGFTIAAGLAGASGHRFLSQGRLDQADPRRAAAETVFEIGSLTKAFMGLLLADMTLRGKVALDEPVARLLPAPLHAPAGGARPITLLDLATHTAGLPFMPEGAPASAADLAAYVAGYRVTREVGADWEYSNLGYWLLGEALAARGGADLPTLMRARVLGPLGLSDTGFHLTPRMARNLAPGHDASFQHAAAFRDLPTYSLMPAAGGLYSTIADLLRLLDVCMGVRRSPLSQALALTLSARRAVSPTSDQGLGWTVMKPSGRELVFRDGGTFGYASCLAWDPARRLGAVTLSNQIGDVSDIARHLVWPDLPLERPAASQHVEIALDDAALAAYAGRYEAEGEGVFSVRLEGGHLRFDAPADWGLPRQTLRPESPRNFFSSELPLRVSFQIGPDGRAIGILIYPPRGQKAVPATRIGPP